MWTYREYAETISLFKRNGYVLGSFENFLNDPFEKYVVLRHDIDFDPRLLEPMLEIEQELGVTSTTFFRTCARQYGVSSGPNLRLISAIHSAGSEVGLHLDTGMEYFWNVTAEIAAERQKIILEASSGKEIIGFSLHQPGKNGGIDFANYLSKQWDCRYHAYDDTFFKGMRYLSDSGGRWRDGHWSEYANKENQLQVLTHPIWHHDGHPQMSF